MASLAGRSAIVTGGSRGIGLAIAQALLDEGASVCITGRKQESLDEAVASLGSDRAIAVAGNAAEAGHRAETVQMVVRAVGHVDILVNNTGINPAYGPMIDADLALFAKTIDTNVVAALGWVQEVHRASMRERGGAIVNVASVAGLRPSVNIGGYSASKAALIALTRQLSVELGPTIRVNAVAPAVVRTRFAQAMYEHDEAGVAARYPLKRLGAPEDIVAAVAFLVSPGAAWITGETIVVDGGVMNTGGV
jgi:NAD(P)-dependent dehydrogenase (short-subunit alcohol dehydrogenase family)